MTPNRMGAIKNESVKGRVTILMDNVAIDKSDMVAEDRFSAHVETDSSNFLFDTEHEKSVVHNAYLFEKDLHFIDKIVLSHSHGDHIGGLPDVLRLQGKKPIDVYAHSDIFLYRYRKKNGKKTYSGIPFTKGYLD